MCERLELLILINEEMVNRRSFALAAVFTAVGCAADGEEDPNMSTDGTTTAEAAGSDSSGALTANGDDDDAESSSGGGKTSGTPTDCGTAEVSEVSLFQVLETRLYADGGPTSDSSVPVVAGRRGLVRARAQGGIVRVDADGVVYESDVTDGEARIVLPAEAIGPQTSLSVEVAGCPDSRIDSLALNAVVTGPIEIHLVPFEIGGFEPDTSASVVDGFRDAVFAVYPATDVVVTVGDVVPDAYGGQVDMGGLLVDLGVIQEQTSAAPHVYYYGLVTGSETREEFCDDCPTGTSEAGNGDRAAFSVGAAFADQRSEDTLIHELGHMHGLLHAPCGDPDLLDDDFPYEDAATTIEGWDFRTETFVEVGARDMMAYCYPRWVSDYNYRNLVDWVQLAQTWR